MKKLGSVILAMCAGMLAPDASAQITSACFRTERHPPECMHDGVLEFTGTRRGVIELGVSLQVTAIDPDTGHYVTPSVLPAWSFVTASGSRRGPHPGLDWIRLARGDQQAAEVLAFDELTGLAELLLEIPVARSSDDGHLHYPAVNSDVSIIEIVLGSRSDLEPGDAAGTPSDPRWTLELGVDPQEEPFVVVNTDAFTERGGSSTAILYTPESAVAQVFELATTSSDIATVEPSQLFIGAGEAGALFTISGVNPGSFSVRVLSNGVEVYKSPRFEVRRAESSITPSTAAAGPGSPGDGPILLMGQLCEPFVPEVSPSAFKKKCSECWYPGMPQGGGTPPPLDCPSLSFFVKEGACVLGFEHCELFLRDVELPAYTYSGSIADTTTEHNTCPSISMTLNAAGEWVVVRVGASATVQIKGERTCCHYQIDDDLVVLTTIEDCTDG